jgi:hypothetical protein
VAGQSIDHRLRQQRRLIELSSFSARSFLRRALKVPREAYIKVLHEPGRGSNRGTGFSSLRADVKFKLAPKFGLKVIPLIFCFARVGSIQAG